MTSPNSSWPQKALLTVAATGSVTLALTIAWVVWAALGVADTDAATRAATLARAISEALNCVALATLVLVPVGLVALVALIRARRMQPR